MAKFNIKEAFLNHVEKAVFGIVLILAIFGLISSDWFPYSGTPYEITDKVAQGSRVLRDHRWPEEEQAEFRISDQDAPANIVHERLQRSIDPTNLAMSGKMLVDLRGGNEPLEEPSLLRAIEPLALAGVAYLSQAVEPPPTPKKPKEEPAPSASDIEDEQLPDDLRPRTPGALGGAGGGAMASIGQALGYGDIAGELMNNPSVDLQGILSQLTGRPAAPMVTTTDEEEPPPPSVVGKGYRFVSVRAVFPLRDQIQKYADAIHKPYNEAAKLFDIRDFELQRQTMQPGDDPWSGPWETVDMDVAADVLDKSSGFDADVVNSMITNNVITMPLPMRISGVWMNTATHPRLKKYELSEKEMEMEVRMQRKLLEEAAEKKKQQSVEETKKGGFASFQFDTRSLQSDVMGLNLGAFNLGTGGGMQDLSFMAAAAGINIPSNIMSQLGGGGGGRNNAPARGPQARPNRNAPKDPLQQLVENMAKGSFDPKDSSAKQQIESEIRSWIEGRVSADGELLLFRYLDFGVAPGETYRYRVRFVLANPNFGKRIADAGGMQHVVEGETRTTEWSEVTAPSTVPRNLNYYLTDVRDMRNQVFPRARFDTFQWDSNYGTTMNAELEVRIGQKVGDTVDTTVIDPAESLLEKRPYQFNSNDFLVDVIEDFELDPDLHEKSADGMTIKLAVGSQNRMQLATRALVHGEQGDLRQIGAGTQKQEHEIKKRELALQTKQFEALKQQADLVNGLPGPEQIQSILAGMGLSASSLPPGVESMIENFTGRSSRLRNQMKKNRKGKDGE